MERREFLQISSTILALAAADPGNLANSWSESEPASAEPLTAASYQTSRKFAVTSFGRIAYIERGKGPAALFLHGFPLNSFQWRGVIPLLAAHRRCIAPDYLGLGFTEIKEGQSVAPAEQAAMITAFLDKLHISSVDIIANDSGGAIAQLLLKQHPKLIRTVLLTNCDAEPDSPPPAVMPVIALAKQGEFADKLLAPWLADKELARSPKGLGGACYAEPTHPTDEALDYYLGPLVSSLSRKQQTNAYAVALEPNPLAGIEPALKNCRVPVRIVWGTADTIFSQASPDYLDRTLGNSLGVRRVPGAKLFFPEERPELIVEEAKKLWRI
ncbi:MAG TPA: alpha/beta hydrolase [Candidatus Sulfotelmatobacter sp.]|jgi:haloalkane dehalogenase|nr:alpha/beta hydrolase [Candidatus Sulfotelmatobacter sp.]